MIRSRRWYFGLIVIVFGLSLFLLILTRTVNSQSKFEPKESTITYDKASVKKRDYVPGEIIVKYRSDKLNLKNESGLSKLIEIRSRLSLEEKYKFKELNVELLKTKRPIEEVIKELKKDVNIEFAEPNFLRYPAVINMNDTNGGLLWGLDNTGQVVNGISGTVDKDIDASAAWGLSQGDGVIVAVIDSGVAYNHPDLVNNMWDGSSCKDENGNFIGGCNHGYDFENNDKDPQPDTSSHGTHVAGIIAAEGNNLRGIIGVSPKAKIMALKSGLDVASEVKAIDFAIQNGAKIINASFGNNSYSQLEFDAINRFKTAGGIFVAAAGNGGNDGVGDNNDSIPFYPASYSLDNIISVAATDQNDNLATFSNYGSGSVDVGAPGVNIFSTIPSESVTMSEGFNNLSAPNIPMGWDKEGINNNFGTYSFGGVIGNVLYGDLNYPYSNNTNAWVVSPTYDLTNSGNISFVTRCDTEYKHDGWYDYMALDFSSDGGANFVEFIKWDEPTLDYLNSDSDPSSGAVYFFDNLNIPNQFRTSNFKFRFRWVTNSSDNAYDGCFVDNIKITGFSDGNDEFYNFMNGTSMAAPHVSGAVASLMYKYPSLTPASIKDTIINNGADPISALSGKTVYGKRLNLYRSLLFNETVEPGTVFRFWSNQNRHHFYTAFKDERDKVASVYDEEAWKYEGTAYKAFLESGDDRVPLYRFWSNRNKAHFYTANEMEKDKVIETYKNDPDGWAYEAIAYYVYGKDFTGPSLPVYRFWSNQNRGHFYTSSETEKNLVIDKYTDDQWLYEGEVFRIPL